MPKPNTKEIITGPKRVFCSHAYKKKAVFPNYKAALNFLQDFCEDFTRHQGTYAKSIYYCPTCNGWHLTKRIPAFEKDFPGYDGVIVNGNVYVPRPLGDGVNACYVCDKEVAEKCHEGKFMPCLAYKENVCLKRADRMLLAKSISIEE